MWWLHAQKRLLQLPSRLRYWEPDSGRVWGCHQRMCVECGVATCVPTQASAIRCYTAMLQTEAVDFTLLKTLLLMLLTKITRDGKSGKHESLDKSCMCRAARSGIEVQAPCSSCHCPSFIQTTVCMLKLHGSFMAPCLSNYSWLISTGRTFQSSNQGWGFLAACRRIRSSHSPASASFATSRKWPMAFQSDKIMRIMSH